MNYIISIEGQTIPVPEEIGSSDEAVKRALTPFYPEAANAMITRTTKEETVTITVVKRAGSKGTGLQDVIDCQGGRNPALALYEEINALEIDGLVDPVQLLELDKRIDTAVSQGEEQKEAVQFAAERLLRAVAHPAPALMLGF